MLFHSVCLFTKYIPLVVLSVVVLVVVGPVVPVVVIGFGVVVVATGHGGKISKLNKLNIQI